MIMKDETIDSLFKKDFLLIQEKAGYRFSLDPLLLAFFTKIKPNEQVIDLGAGNGIISLLLSKIYTEAKYIAVEVQSRSADQALRNIIINREANKIQVLQEDVKNLPSLLPPGTVDVIVSNPPYRPLNTGRINPNSCRAKARHEVVASLKTFLTVTSVLLRNGGRAYFMFPAFRLAELISLLKECRLEPKVIQLIYCSLSSEASHVLVEALKNRQVGLRVLPPFFLYTEKSIVSETLEKVYEYFRRGMEDKL